MQTSSRIDKGAFLVLVLRWKLHRFEGGKYSYQRWSCEGNHWPKLDNLPSDMYGPLVDCRFVKKQFNNKMVETNAFPPSDNGLLQSFGSLSDEDNETTKKIEFLRKSIIDPVMLYWNARPTTTTTNTVYIDDDSSSIALGLKNAETGRSVDLILLVNNNTLADTFQNRQDVKSANVLQFNFETTKKLRDKNQR